MAIEAIETCTDAVLRREYMVRVAVLVPYTEAERSRHLHSLFNGVVPLFGGAHEDREIIRFPHRHYHVDWRFASTKTYAAAWKDTWTSEKGNEKAMVVEASEVLRLDAIPLTLRRHAVEYPHRPDSWQPRLEAAYADKTLGKGMICPHQGARLSSCQVNDGCVRCPLHGLNWDVATGQLVPLF